MRVKKIPIAIITFGRAGQVTTFERLGLPLDRYTLFVDTEKEAMAYSVEYPDVDVVITGTTSAQNARNALLDHYGEGAQVVQADDDVLGIFRLVGERTLQQMQGNELDSFIQKAFRACRKYGVHHWGVYPIKNHFFMSHRINPSGFVIGTFCGVCVTDLRYDTAMALKEDYDFTLQHIVEDGKILRFDDICVEARHYTNKGGAVTRTVPRNDAEEERCIEHLIGKYPNYVRRNPRRTNEVLLTFKTPRGGRND